MQAVEFTVELGTDPVLRIPPDAAAQLPKTGNARIIVLTQGESDDLVWRRAAYEHFMRDDAPEDQIYDNDF